MKKTFKSTVICAIVVLLSFAMSISSSFAQQSNSLNENIQQTADYLYNLIDGEITAYDGTTILNLIKAGKDCSSLAEQLKSTDWSSLTYAQLAINAAAVKMAGGEADKPEFTDEINLSVENPYNLCTLLSLLSEDETEIKQSVIAALKAYYNKESGNGFDYYGFSADTNGLFYGALAPYAAEDEELAGMLTDALGYLDKVKSDAGYGFSEEYPDANASSTAGALTAFAAAGDKSAADSTYKMLMTYASATEIGAFEYGGFVSTYSTTDALRAMLDYSKIAEDEPVPTATSTQEAEASPTNEPTPSSTPENTPVPNPETGIYFYTNGTSVYVAAILAAAVTVFMVRGKNKKTCGR